MFRFNAMRWRIPLLKRLVPSIKRRMATWSATGGARVVRSQGALFLVNIDNYVDRQIAFYDDYENAQVSRLLGEARRRGCECFIDIGANCGYYTVLFALEPTIRKMIAFEPDPRNFDQLRANLLLNGLSVQVETHRLALSDQAGTIALELAPAGTTGQTRVVGAGSFVAAAARLDDVLDLSGQRIAIKIDIEGHEPQAVLGMPRLLANNDCVLQIESFAPQVEWLRRELAAAGYREIGRIADDYYFERANTGAT